MNTALTCKVLASELLTGPRSENLWRLYVINTAAPGIPTAGVNGDVKFWKTLAFETNRAVVKNLLRMKHFEYRLEQPPSCKDFLKFFCVIETSGSRPKRDLLGDVISGEFDDIRVPSVLIQNYSFKFVGDFKITFTLPKHIL